MSVKEELEQIAKKSGGVLSPEDVVEFAKNPATVLHSRFTWDDTEAARQHRLWQARKVIACVVVTKEVSPSKELKIRTYFSLPDSRGGMAGSYYHIDKIMSDDDLMAKLEQMCENELKAVRAKYNAVKKYAALFEMIDNI